MSSLITADIVLGVLGVVNLVLLLGLVRGLRAHAKAIEAGSKGGGTAPEVMIAPGAPSRRRPPTARSCRETRRWTPIAGHAGSWSPNWAWSPAKISRASSR